MNYIRSYEGYTIYFILHALTLITAFTWHQLLQDYLGTLSSKQKALTFAFIYAIIITVVSVTLHIFLGKYSIQPDDK